MPRYTASKPRPTKVSLFVKDGVWVAQLGNKTATAPFRVEAARTFRGGVMDFGKFDALEKLCGNDPVLWNAGYVVLEKE